MYRARFGIAGLMAAALTGAFFLAQGSDAGDEKPALPTIDKIAAAYGKGDKAGAKKMSAAFAKELIDDLHAAMDILRPRKKDGKGGAGVGAKPGALIPDHIDQMIAKLSKPGPTPAQLKESAALEQMGLRTAAVADIALLMPQGKDSGTKLKKDWLAWSTDMHEGALALAAAAKAKNVADIKSSATKLNASCVSCHAIFRQ